MDFNNTIPEWQNTGTEPSDSLKNSGFSAGYKPPANVFNWFWNRVTKAITEIQTNLSNVDNTSDANKPVSTATQTALNNKVDKVSGKGLSTNDYTTTDKNKLAGIASGAQVNTVTGVKGSSESSYRTGNISISKSNIGLGNVDNTSDANKPISTAVQTALNGKADSSAIIPNDSNTTYAYRSSAGWYRMAKYVTDDTTISQGIACNSCEIVVYTRAASYQNEYHHLYFDGVHINRKFGAISNLSNWQIWDKIRYVEVSENGVTKSYIDIHAQTSSSNDFVFKLLNAKNMTTAWTTMAEYVGTSDVSGQVVYDIPANSDVAQKEVTLWSGVLSALSTSYCDITAPSYKNYTTIGVECADTKNSRDVIYPIQYIEKTVISDGTTKGIINFGGTEIEVTSIANTDKIRFRYLSGSISGLYITKISGIL